MTPEKQRLLFRELLCLSRNADGHLQNGSRAAFLRLDISYSTVAHTLDFFLKSKGCSYIPGFISHLRWTLVVDDFLMIRLYGYNVFAFCFVVISLLRTKSCCKLLTPSAMKAGFEIKLAFTMAGS